MNRYPLPRRRGFKLLLFVLALAALALASACSGDKPESARNETSHENAAPNAETGTGSANGGAGAESNGEDAKAPADEKGDAGTPESAPKAPSGPLIPVPVSGLNGTSYGYIDSSGKLVIPARYSYASPFDAAGWAQAYIGEEEGELQLIGMDGKAWFSSRNASVIGSESGVVAVMSGDRYLLLKAGTGEKLFETAGELSAPKNGRIRFANVATKGKRTYGYLDLNGRTVVEPKYAAVEDFNEGKAVVQRGEGDYALIDENGKTLTEFAAGTYLVTGYGEGLVAFKEAEDRPYGYADEKGNVAIAPKFFSAEPFKNGVAIVSAGDDDRWQYGLIDRNGQPVVEPSYDYLFRAGSLFQYGKAGEDDPNPLYAPGDAEGRLKGPFELESIAEDGAGHLYATDGETTFFLTEDGTKDESLPVFEGSASLRLEDGVVTATEYGRLRVVRTDGEDIWRESRSYSVSDDVSVVEQSERMPPNKYVYYPKLQGLPSRDAERAVNEAIRQEAAASLEFYRNPDGETAEEDEAARDTEVSGDFEVAGVKGSLLVLRLTGYQYSRGAAHGNPWTNYLNIDLATGEVFRLDDLIPDPRGQRAVSTLLIKQMKDDAENEYWLDDYEGVDGDSAFYIRGDSLVIYFNPYEIAPYAAGFPEFEIPFREVDKWIDKSGAFWKTMQ